MIEWTAKLLSKWEVASLIWLCSQDMKGSSSGSEQGGSGSGEVKEAYNVKSI